MHFLMISACLLCPFLLSANVSSPFRGISLVIIMSLHLKEPDLTRNWQILSSHARWAMMSGPSLSYKIDSHVLILWSKESQDLQQHMYGPHSM